MNINLNFDKDIKGNRIVSFVKGEIHLTVRPHILLEDDGTLKDHGLEVEFWGDIQGKRDPGNLLHSNIVFGTREDLEEVADTYARRLESNINPKDMFNDIIENNRQTDSEIKTS